MFDKFSAGVSYADQRAQLVILQIKKRKIKLRHVEEYARAEEQELWFLDPLLKRRTRVVRKTSKVSIALDNASVLLHSFPMDNSLNQVEQNEFVTWELSNYVEGYREKKYINDAHLLQTHVQGKVSELFVIAARRSLIFGIQEALSDQKFQLHITDTNHFGAQYALLVNYPDVRTKIVALAVLSGERTDLGILNQGKLVYYRYAPVSSPEDVLDFLQSQLRLYAADQIFLCGGAATDTLVEGAEQRLGIHAELLNPFKRLAGGSLLRDLAGQEHRYASAVGCALRKQ